MRASTGPRMARRGCACQLPLTVLLSIRLFRICGKDLLSASNTSPSTTSARSKSAAARPSSPSQMAVAPSASSMLPSSCNRRDAMRSAARPRQDDRSARVGSVPFQTAQSSASGAAMCRFTKSCRSLSGGRRDSNPSRPGGGRYPRQTQHSRSRTCLRNMAGGSPPATMGCFRNAKAGRGAKSSAIMLTSSIRKPPALHADSGRPAESSTLICQRCRAVITASASCRSGVTSAAVFSGVSRTSRMASAMIFASTARFGAAITLKPASASRPSSGCVLPSWRQSAVRAAGLNTSRISA